MGGERIRLINKGQTQRLFGRIIKPNEVFLGYADEIPVKLRSTIVPVDPAPIVVPPRPTPPPVIVPEPVPVVVTAPPPSVKTDSAPSFEPARVTTSTSYTRTKPIPVPDSPVITAGYCLRERSPGWFDVVDHDGKVINEQPLREYEAREMLDKLE